MKKRILSIVLAICLLFTLVPTIAFAETAGGTYTQIEGTSGAGGGEGPEKLIDGSIDTKWCVTDFKGAYIVFQTSTAVQVSGYSITTGNDNATCTGRNPKNWTLYGCNDYTGSSTGSWTEIHRVKDDVLLQDVNKTTYNYAFARTETAYQYFKLEITSTKGSDVMQMSEFSLTSCEHSLGDPVTTPATCTVDGNTKITCSKCNGSMVTRIPMAHEFTGEGGACKHCSCTIEELRAGYLDENGVLRPQATGTTAISSSSTNWGSTGNKSW